MEVLLMIVVPNWQHHSNKQQGRTLKPQAMRSAKKRVKALIKRLNSQSDSQSRTPCTSIM